MLDILLSVNSRGDFGRKCAVTAAILNFSKFRNDVHHVTRLLHWVPEYENDWMHGFGSAMLDMLLSVNSRGDIGRKCAVTAAILIFSKFRNDVHHATTLLFWVPEHENNWMHGFG